MTETGPQHPSASSRSRGERWNDLGVRVLSGLVLAGLGIVSVWAGGTLFLGMTVAVFVLMAWELASLTDVPDNSGGQSGPRLRIAIAALAGLGLLAAQWGGPAVLALLPAPLLMAATPRRDRLFLSAYLLAVLVAAHGFVALDRIGAVIVVWLVLIVVVSDVLGYFAGRLIGGPKFWPAISPKKTWAGTVAGWIGAAVLGLVFAIAQGGGWALVLIAPLVAFAGQMGDIVESLLKRRAGVKDASRLIPGHGGVLDRFDALIGAILAVWVLQMFITLPLGLHF